MVKRSWTKSWVSVVFFAALTNSISASASWLPDWMTFNFNLPYIGADIQERRMDFKGGFGDNLLYRTAPQGNFYAGFRFNDYMGLEAGYESTKTRSRTVTLTAGEIAAGAPILPAGSPAIFRSKIKIHGPHVDLVGFLPICEVCCPFDILGSIGIARLKAEAERTTVAMGPLAQPGTTRTLSTSKTVWRFAAGLQYNWTDHLGLRATINWVDTGKLVLSATDNIAGRVVPEIKPKVSTVYGFGALWQF